MKTDWQLEYEEEEKLEVSDFSVIEVKDQWLYDRKPDIGNRFAYRDVLSRVPLPQRRFSKKNLILTPHRQALRALYEVYGFALFSFQSANKLKEVRAGLLERLWSHGYLEKWALGEYNRRGNFFGVHYRIIKWPL